MARRRKLKRRTTELFAVAETRAEALKFAKQAKRLMGARFTIRIVKFDGDEWTRAGYSVFADRKPVAKPYARRKRRYSA